MPEHRRRHRRHSRSSGQKLRLIDFLLLVWSIASLAGFFLLLDKEDRAPFWQIAALAGSTLVGLILFFSFGLSTKKK